MRKLWTMTLSKSDLIAIIKAAADSQDLAQDRTKTRSLARELTAQSSESIPTRLSRRTPRWAIELKHMLNAVAELNFDPAGRTSVLQTMCEAGARYGLQRLETNVSSELLVFLSQSATRRLKQDLRRSLARITRPCLTLELNAFRSAFEAIYFRSADSNPGLLQQKFLETGPSNRLLELFKKFPVLAKLWAQLISQWSDNTKELLVRFRTDRHAVSRAFFFSGQPVGKIIDIRCGLSDPHTGGRSVILLKFASGSLIYKPRSGNGEWQWGKLIHWLNAHSFRPQLKAARVLRRKRYCWMEWIPSISCENAAANRFYRRLGGMIALAYLVRAVDCHRDNLIVSGEYPVLIDAETLWHVSNTRKTNTLINSFYQTGFFPTSNLRSSWEFRSSILVGTTSGQHSPRVASVGYRREIVAGFLRVWRCILGSIDRRADFVQSLGPFRQSELRRIYWPTINYDRIRQASIQPSALTSGITRDTLIGRLCRRSGVPSAVIEREVRALKRFDIPYFVHKQTPDIADKTVATVELMRALRQAIHF